MVAESSTASIRDVWAKNIEEEFGKIREIVTKYPYIAMVSVFL